jgi:hypothetical protein
MGMSHTVTAIAPVAADSWTAVGTITVPAGAKSLKIVGINYAVDPGTAAVLLHSAPVVRLIGSGLVEQSPHSYVGPGVDAASVAATAGYNTSQPKTKIYDVDIGVSVGGTIDVQVNSLDEVVAGQCAVMLGFSPDAPKGLNSMSDYVDAPIPAAADAWTTVGTLTVPQAKEGASPKRIKKVICEFVPDVAATAVSERASTRFRISGAGVAEPGLHEFLGPGLGGYSVVTGPGLYDQCDTTYDVDIPVNAGGTILVETIHDTELMDGGTSVFGVLYE